MLEISAVVPALNAGPALAATLSSVSGMVREIVVSDGGSTDGTPDLARGLGAIVVEGAPGRGKQLIRGAMSATADWLLFLHADTRLDAGWRAKAEAILGANPDRAGYFRFVLDDDAPQARRLERMVAWRARYLGLPYGDQGMLISRRLYDAVGGYRDMPLMEDVDLVRRIGRRNLLAIPAAATTSARRFKRDGYTARSARNVLCLGLYFAGVAPAAIKRIYG